MVHAKIHTSTKLITNLLDGYDELESSNEF